MDLSGPLMLMSGWNCLIKEISNLAEFSFEVRKLRCSFATDFSVELSLCVKEHLSKQFPVVQINNGDY